MATTTTPPPLTIEQQMLRIRIRLKRDDVDGFLGRKDFEDGKPPAEHTHEEAARAIIMRGGWPTERGFQLLDLIGKPELKAQYVDEKIAAISGPEYVESHQAIRAAAHAEHTEPCEWCILCPSAGEFV